VITFALNIACNKNSHLFEFIHSKWSLSLSGKIIVMVVVPLLSAALLIGTATGANSLLAYSNPLNALLQINPKGAIGGENTFTKYNQIKAAIKSNIDNGSNAGIVIALVDPNGTQFYGYGKMSATNQTNVNKNTLFDIGSITKSFTTLLLAVMAKHGLVNLNDPIEKYLPATVKVPTYNGQHITLESLATHTSGLPDNPPNMPLTGPGFQNYRFAQMYQALSDIRLTRAPGSQYNYSNFGMALLGDILASKAGMPYEQLVINRITNVLGMNSTRITLSDQLHYRLALGHLNGVELPASIENPLPLAPAGSFRSTASDMAKYLSVNMGLTKTTLYNAMQQSHVMKINTNMSGFSGFRKIYIGLGWFTTTINNGTNGGTSRNLIWDNGIFNGYNSFIGFNPAKHKGIAILCSALQRNLLISQIGFGPYDRLSNLLWNLLMD
jgi:serine-type D-Ala-D-Ala carboxypeptidase/endopeptidase